ncbi:hypothetical protein M3664_04415 [Paenibacillus lautus]|uniref:hypothetical protein n=1 Tax=Paenibacillus lautus TaxID=1401 RepID=UPI00203A7070|nr:hypothetical protein [Paenibacillus lautus]MCM3257024.1 hypothetical protein [Paenibacillus lautus]
MKKEEYKEVEVVFEGVKGKKRPKNGGSKFRREVGEEAQQPIISEEIFCAVKQKIDNLNKLK